MLTVIFSAAGLACIWVAMWDKIKTDIIETVYLAVLTFCFLGYASSQLDRVLWTAYVATMLFALLASLRKILRLSYATK